MKCSYLIMRCSEGTHDSLEVINPQLNVFGVVGRIVQVIGPCRGYNLEGHFICLHNLGVFAKHDGASVQSVVFIIFDSPVFQQCKVSHLLPVVLVSLL